MTTAAKLIKFQATVKDGVIEIPHQYQQDVTQAASVEITVLKPEATLSDEEKSKEDIVDFLTQNPIEIDQFPTRDEMHDR